MKAHKIFIAAISTLISITATAQLKVDNNGKVNFGSTTSYNYGRLNLGLDGQSNGIAFYGGSGTPFYVFRNTNAAYLTRGTNERGGMKITHYGSIVMGTYVNGFTRTGAWATLSVLGEDKTSLEIYGKHSFDGGDILKVTSENPNSHAIAVWNESNKNFIVTGEGAVYSNTQLITSDESTKTNIETIESPLDKVLKLRGVTFNSKLMDTKEIKMEDFAAPAGSDELTKMTAAKITPTILKQLNEEKKRKHMGVVAQEVEVVVPEVVRTAFDGTKAVSYVELVGLLIEAVKEQQEQIDELKKLVSPTIKTKSADENFSSEISSVILTKNQLYQNVPNPFSISTEIRYSLDETVSKANLYIYDMQGKQIKNIANLSRGEGSVTIQGYELNPGMYIYSLIADGKEIDTKRMILTD